MVAATSTVDMVAELFPSIHREQIDSAVAQHKGSIEHAVVSLCALSVDKLCANLAQQEDDLAYAQALAESDAAFFRSLQQSLRDEARPGLHQTLLRNCPPRILRAARASMPLASTDASHSPRATPSVSPNTIRRALLTRRTTPMLKEQLLMESTRARSATV